MKLIAPDFWWKSPPSWRARLLVPVSWLYHIAGWLQQRFMTPYRSDTTVICVGNFTAGGAGKTPTAIALAEILINRGEAPFFLTRGYKGRMRGPILVEPEEHTVAEVGDEALLLANCAPTIVSADRRLGARLAEELGASHIIMDDGMQNPALCKNLVLAVIDAGVGIGNGLIIPAGPLRAPLGQQLARVDAVIVIGALSSRPPWLTKGRSLDAHIRDNNSDQDVTAHGGVTADMEMPTDKDVTGNKRGSELSTHRIDENFRYREGVPVKGVPVKGGPVKGVPVNSANAEDLSMLSETGGPRFQCGDISVPLLYGRLTPCLSPEELADLQSRPCIAFSGIGRPEKFFASLRAADIALTATESFADHHMFSDEEARRLLAQAEQGDATLVTTEKDFMRLKGRGDPHSAMLAERVMVFPVILEFDRPMSISHMLY